MQMWMVPSLVWLCLPLVLCLHWASLFIFSLMEQVWISWWDPKYSQALGSGLAHSGIRGVCSGALKSVVVRDERNNTTLDQQNLYEIPVL